MASVKYDRTTLDDIVIGWESKIVFKSYEEVICGI